MRVKNKQNRRQPAFAVMVVAILVAVVGSAFADTYEPLDPPAPFPNPLLLVTPDDNLTDGQVVQVNGRRFGGNVTNGVLRQCTADRMHCSGELTPFTTGRTAEFNPPGEPDNAADPPFIPVNFTVRATFTATNGTPVDCRVSACIIDAYNVEANPVKVNRACHALSFGPTDPTPCGLIPASDTTLPTSLPSTTSPTAPTTSTTAPTTSTTGATTSTTGATTSTTGATTSTTGATTSTTAPTTSTTAPTTSTTAPTTSTTQATTSTTQATTSTTGATTSTTGATTTTQATTTTAGPVGTTTTLPGTTERCAALRQLRAQFNAEVDRLVQSIAALGPFAQPFLAALEQARASGNASIDQALAISGCTVA